MEKINCKWLPAFLSILSRNVTYSGFYYLSSLAGICQLLCYFCCWPSRQCQCHWPRSRLKLASQVLLISMLLISSDRRSAAMSFLSSQWLGSQLLYSVALKNFLMLKILMRTALFWSWTSLRFLYLLLANYFRLRAASAQAIPTLGSSCRISNRVNYLSWVGKLSFIFCGRIISKMGNDMRHYTTFLTLIFLSACSQLLLPGKMESQRKQTARTLTCLQWQDSARRISYEMKSGVNAQMSQYHCQRYITIHFPRWYENKHSLQNLTRLVTSGK